MLTRVKTTDLNCQPELFIGWMWFPSPQKDDIPVDVPVGEEELTWIMTMTMAGGLGGTLVPEYLEHISILYVYLEPKLTLVLVGV